MTKQKRLLDLSVERKDLIRLVKRVYENVNYIRVRASELPIFSTRKFDYSRVLSKLVEAQNALNEVAKYFND